MLLHSETNRNQLTTINYSMFARKPLLLHFWRPPSSLCSSSWFPFLLFRSHLLQLFLKPLAACFKKTACTYQWLLAVVSQASLPSDLSLHNFQYTQTDTVRQTIRKHSTDCQGKRRSAYAPLTETISVRVSSLNVSQNFTHLAL